MSEQSRLGRRWRRALRAFPHRRSKSCNICLQIVRALKTRFEELSIYLGTVAEVLSLPCVFHTPLLLHYLNNNPKYAKCFDEVYLTKSEGTQRVRLFYNKSAVHLAPSLALVKKPSISGNSLHGKIVNFHWIDIGLLRRWKTMCDTRHGKDCLSLVAPNLPGGRSILLIDTWRMCLTYSSLNDRYVALSYVWGKVTSLKTVKANLQQLLVDQAFASSSEFSKHIPTTIKNAMEFIGLLHERYLWVDCLCIVQDDNQESLRQQLNSMALIYANASLTIIASGEDANYGLRGIRGITQARKYHQNVFTFPKGCKIIERRDYQMLTTIWATRAWTFQENLFSRRRLVFRDQGMRWECPCATWYDDLELIGDFDAGSSETQDRRKERAAFSLAWPNLRTYIELVSRYSVRELTYEDDVAAAFAGITTSLSRTFEGGFLWGLAELFFDVALLWQHDRTGGNIEQRIPNDPSRNSHLPSWSWMGWHAYIDFSSWDSGVNYIKRTGSQSVIDPDDRETIPILQWYIIEETERRKRPILSTWRKYRHCVNLDQKLPTGWTRHPYCDPDFPVNQKCFFTHESDPKTEFWYPIPIPDRTTIPIIRAPATLLACRTQRGWLQLTEKVMRKDMDLIWYDSHTLQDESGARVGYLVLHGNQSSTSEFKVQKFSSQREKCELIAISGGYENIFRAVEWICQENTKSTKYYEFYNVLWIEWIDGIAYRKALGRVLRDKWEAQALEWIDVVLG